MFYFSCSCSHLQPISPKAPALQHSPLLPGSHHRPGRRRPFVLLDVEAPQTGLPSCPRAHTCKSRLPLVFLCRWFCWLILEVAFCQSLRTEVLCFWRAAAEAVQISLSVHSTAMTIGSCFISVNCKQRGNVKHLSSRLSDVFFSSLFPGNLSLRHQREASETNRNNCGRTALKSNLILIKWRCFVKLISEPRILFTVEHSKH